MLGYHRVLYLGHCCFLFMSMMLLIIMLSFGRVYADDNSTQYADKNLINIECVLNYDLKILEKWSEDWLLKFDPNKRKVNFFLNILKPFFMVVNLNKFPRICIWVWILNNAHKKLGLIKILKYSLCREKLSKMYKTFVRPILEYASVVWVGCINSDLDKLEKVQLYAARIVNDLPIICIFWNWVGTILQKKKKILVNNNV